MISKGRTRPTTKEFGVGPNETDVAKTVAESKYLSVAAADKSFMSDAGLRCEFAFDSKTISPVLTSMRETDGLLNAGEAAMRANTFAALTGSNAEALEVVKILAATMAALNPKYFFICILPFLAFNPY